MLRKFLVALISSTLMIPMMAQQAADPVPIARKALDLLLSAKYHELHAMFNDQMLRAVTEDTLASQIGPQIKAWGKAEKIGEPTVQHVQNVSPVIFPVHFTATDIGIMIPIDSDGKVAGLRFVASPSTEKKEVQWSPAPYVHAGSFHEQEASIGTTPWKLPGTLSIPNGTGPFPAVVLVHGSGPNDRDETVAANKPFRDIAEGLASRGLAVLRYDKRTQVYGPQMAAMKDLTVEQETIADALEAAKFLRAQRDVDSKRIYLIGHSLGAYLAPRIAERDPQLAGIVIMAGITRPLADVMVDQYDYLGTPPAQLDKVKAAAAEIHDLKTAEGPSILGAPRSYWLDLNSYNPKAVVQKLHCRILVLQGARDYQVTQPDYQGWKTALAGDANATFHLYPALNHLFIAGEGKSLPAEYEKPGHVDSEVINDIAAWIQKSL